MVSNIKGAKGGLDESGEQLFASGRMMPAFSLERNALGVNIRIIGYFRLERSPLADPRIKGMLEIKGERLPVFDPHALTSFSPRELTKNSCVVVDRDCQGGRFARARLVEDVWEMLEMARAKARTGPVN